MKIRQSIREIFRFFLHEKGGFPEATAPLETVDEALFSSRPEPEARTDPAPLAKEEERDEAEVLKEGTDRRLDHLLRIFIAGRVSIDRAIVLLYDREKEALWIRVAKGKSEPLGVDLKRAIPIGRGLLGRVAKEQKTASIGNLRSSGERLEYDDGSVIPASFLALPLFEDDRFEGLLCVDGPADPPFSSEDEEVARWVAEEILAVLRWDRERRRMGQQARVYSVLLEISKSLGSSLDLDHRLEITTESAKKIIDYGCCFIFLAEPGERRMTVKTAKGYDPTIVGHEFPLTNGLLSIVVKNRQVLLFSNLRAEERREKIFPDGCKIDRSCRSFLGLPLVIEDRAIGAVLFLSEEENAFTTYDRHVLSILCNHVAISIAEAQAHAQVERLAVTDGLTGLYNHRRFQERCHEEFVRSARYSDPFSILMIDIDYFKRINDTHGHPAGDAVLKLLSKLLLKRVRTHDLVARYGGEEFVVLLLKSDARQALRMAERIRKGVEATSFEWQGEKIPVTVSIGAASFPEDAGKREDLIACADRALYASKRGGRNRTTLHKDLVKEMYEVG